METLANCSQLIHSLTLYKIEEVLLFTYFWSFTNFEQLDEVSSNNFARDFREI